MAKKRKKEKEAEDKYEFVPPEFDEKQFLMDEMKSTKRLLLIVGYGVLFGVLAAIVTIMERSGYFGLVLFLIGIVFLRYYLSTLKVDVSKLTKKNWAESAMYFFFTFLAIWLIAVNPPFFDNVSPEIKNVSISVVYSGSTLLYNYSMIEKEWKSSSNVSVTAALSYAKAHGTGVNISAHVADSSGLQADPMITLAPNNPQVFSMTSVGNNTFRCSISAFSTLYLNNGQIFTFSISATDNYGNQGSFILPTSAEVDVS